MKRKVLAAIVGVLTVLGAGFLYERYSLPRRGERDFARLRCTACHFSGAGPNLTHVVRRHDGELLERFIANPGDVYRNRNMQPLNDGYMLMPNQHASPEDARAIVAYLRELDQQ
jgi:hypothetical protein